MALQMFNLFAEPVHGAELRAALIGAGSDYVSAWQGMKHERCDVLFCVFRLYRTIH
jgi:hypothetical protein